MTDLALGVDVGGTAIKLGLVDSTGVVCERAILATVSFADLEALADGIALALRRFGDLAIPVGIATPGHADPDSGRLLDGGTNVPVLRHGSLPDALRVRGFTHIHTVNDGVAAAWGESRFGAGRGCDRFALLTMGTGIGGAIVIDGRVMTGAGGVPPELGAMALDGSGTTLEQGAGAEAFSLAYAACGGTPSSAPIDVLARAAASEPNALAAIDVVCRRVAQAFGTMVNLLNLQRCLVGGGISAGGDLLCDRILANMPDFTWRFLLERTEVRIAERGNDAGLLGAAALARAHLS